MSDALHFQRLLQHELLTWRETRAARKAVGQHIRELRQAIGYSPLDLGKQAKAPPTMIGQIENGQAWNADVVKRIQHFFAFYERQQAQKVAEETNEDQA